MIKLQYAGPWRGTNNDTWTDFHDTSLNDPTRYAPGAVITQAVDSIDSLTFDLYQSSIAFSSMDPYRTYVRAIDTDDDSTVFDGRVIGVTPSMDENGMLRKSVTCESVDAFLLDGSVDTSAIIKDGNYTVTRIDDDTYQMDARDFLNAVLYQHNRDNDAIEHITLGTVNLPANATCRFSWTYGTVTRDLLMDFLKRMNANNNHIDGIVVVYYQLFTMRVRDTGNGFALDILDYWNNATAGAIELGRNMGAVSREPDYTDIVTVIRPFGDEYTDSNGVKYRLELSDYMDAYGDIPAATQALYSFSSTYGTITNQDAASTYKTVLRPLLIEGLSTPDPDDGSPTISYDQAAEFIRRCLVYLSRHDEPAVSLQVTAYDLSLIGENIESFDLFQNWDVTHSLLGISENLPIVRRVLDLDNPASSSVEFGTYAPRETDYQNAQGELLQKTAAAAGVDTSSGYASGASGFAGNYGAGSSSIGGSTNYVGHEAGGGGTTIIDGGGSIDLTQYVPSFRSSDSYYKSLICTGEYLGFMSGFSAFTANDLLIPARSICPLTISAYYIGLLWQMGYSDTRIGNLLAYIAGEYVSESHEGIFGMPYSFAHTYYNLHSKDVQGTLVWSDVEKLVDIGAIAYRKNRDWPWVCAMPYLVTGGRAYYNPDSASKPVPLDTDVRMGFEPIATRVQHPTEGNVQISWVLLVSTMKMLNASSSAIGGHASLYVEYHGISHDNHAPDGADPTTFIDRGVMGQLHDDTYGWTTYTPRKSHSLLAWGHSALLGAVDPLVTEGYGTTQSFNFYNAHSIDDGSLIAPDLTVIDWRHTTSGSINW